MIDYDLFDKILSSNDGYIEENDIITKEFFDKLYKYPIYKVSELFKKPKIKNAKYTVVKMCDECEKEFVSKLSKTKILNILKSNSSHICPKCSEKLKKIKSNFELEQLKDREEIEKQNANIYIDNFLNPNKNWDKEIKNYQKILKLQCLNLNEKKLVAKYIKNMAYKDFLKTPYWKAIAEKVKIKSNMKCSLCNSSENLNTHHRSYEHHGYELDNINDLICICNSCHKKFHVLEEE